jgi:hypothetical protein
MKNLPHYLILTFKLLTFLILGSLVVGFAVYFFSGGFYAFIIPFLIALSFFSLYRRIQALFFDPSSSPFITYTKSHTTSLSTTTKFESHFYKLPTVFLGLITARGLYKPRPTCVREFRSSSINSSSKPNYNLTDKPKTNISLTNQSDEFVGPVISLGNNSSKTLTRFEKGKGREKDKPIELNEFKNKFSRENLKADTKYENYLALQKKEQSVELHNHFSISSTSSTVNSNSSGLVYESSRAQEIYPPLDSFCFPAKASTSHSKHIQSHSTDTTGAVENLSQSKHDISNSSSSIETVPVFRAAAEKWKDQFKQPDQTEMVNLKPGTGLTNTTPNTSNLSKPSQTPFGTSDPGRAPQEAKDMIVTHQIPEEPRKL